MPLTTDLLTLAEAAKRCPVLHKDRARPGPASKSRPDTMRLWQWCRVGILARNGRRVRLNHYWVGGRIAVTEADLGIFFKAIADADAEHFDARPAAPVPPAPRPRAAVARSRAATAAGDRLKREGF